MEQSPWFEGLSISVFLITFLKAQIVLCRKWQEILLEIEPEPVVGSRVFLHFILPHLLLCCMQVCGVAAWRETVIWALHGAMQRESRPNPSQFVKNRKGPSPTAVNFGLSWGNLLLKFTFHKELVTSITVYMEGKWRNSEAVEVQMCGNQVWMCTGTISTKDIWTVETCPAL